MTTKLHQLAISTLLLCKTTASAQTAGQPDFISLL
jgi:hypothetical protein